MFVHRVILILVLAAPAVGPARASSPYDVIEEAYAPYVDANDPLGLSLKIKSLSADPYKFWRGSKDLYFAWCRENAGDWLADRASYVPTHGDLHLGNIGTYASAGPLGTLAFGMVDFDDSALLPFQLELLQGLVTLRLIAGEQRIDLTAAQSREMDDVVVTSYRAALTSGADAGALLSDDPEIARLLAATAHRRYTQTLEEFIERGKFRREVRTPKGKLKELLRPADDRKIELADAIAAAIARVPAAATQFRLHTPDQFRTAVKDAVLRTRLGSSGSQGLKKYLVLVERPLAAADHDLIFYLKQQVPSAAERSGAIQREQRSPGRRGVEQMDELTSPSSWFSSWCDMGEESYWVTIKEPWSEELDAEDVNHFADLLRAARVWGTVAGASHGRRGRGDAIAPQLSPAMRDALTARAQAYLAQLTSDFAQFRADPRLVSHLSRTEAALQSISAGLKQQ